MSLNVLPIYSQVCTSSAQIHLYIPQKCHFIEQNGLEPDSVLDPDE